MTSEVDGRLDISRYPAGAVDPGRVARTVRTRVTWRLIVLLAALSYVAATLFVNIDSPLFGLVVIVLMARELVESRRCRARQDVG